jgi:hypothetical protein
VADIVEQLGLDPERLKWHQLAACRGITVSMETDFFFDKYESDEVIALQTDQMCLHCPVIKECFLDGKENKAFGVWGGVYMDLGRPDKKYNAHKTPEIWKALKKIHGKKLAQ